MSRLRTRHVAVAATILAAGSTAVGVAATGDPINEGVRNGTATQETEIVSNTPATTARKGGFSTRQSNLSTTGGGAIYGCRSTAGGTAATPPTNPCIRANNLATGFAFEFNASNGETAGVITVGPGGDSKRPLTTNATGVATGFNADRVDGADAASLRSRFVLVDENGAIAAQSGGFRVITAYPGGDGPAGNQNVYIDTGADATGSGLSATIAIQNTNQDGVANNFGGEISIGACGFDTINCAPDGTENANVIVVSPRTSAGEPTSEGARKRFYVTISE